MNIVEEIFDKNRKRPFSKNFQTNIRIDYFFDRVMLHTTIKHAIFVIILRTLAFDKFVNKVGYQSQNPIILFLQQ